MVSSEMAARAVGTIFVWAPTGKNCFNPWTVLKTMIQFDGQ